MTANYSIGMVGLGVMGANLARNLASRGFNVAGFDLDPRKCAAFNRYQGVVSFTEIESFLAALEKPRRIILLVPHKAVDDAIASLKPHLNRGDLIVDFGNSFFLETERRAAELEKEGLLFIGCGVSGGEKGALRGPSIMPGGRPEAYALVEPAFRAIAAQVDGEPCVTYIGPGGAGHYVKMVHNGIEYGIMQLIAEAYDLLKRGANATAEELHRAFSAWNAAEMNSYLIEITAKIFGRLDPETSRPLVDLILDEARQKGTGKWTTQNAFNLGVPMHSINAAVEARMISALKQDRLAASRAFKGPEPTSISREKLFEDVRQALYASILCAYAQGMALLLAASKEYNYALNLAGIASIWRGGCIIRAALLEDVRQIYGEQPDLADLLLVEPFRTWIEERQSGWRAAIQTAVGAGIPVPGMAASLAYFDAYRSEILPANLIQAQRDYFGSHTYRRTDREGVFHTAWEEA